MRDHDLADLLDEDILAGDYGGHDVMHGHGDDHHGSANMLKNTGIFFGGTLFGILATLITQKLTGNRGSRSSHANQLRLDFGGFGRFSPVQNTYQGRKGIVKEITDLEYSYACNRNDVGGMLHYNEIERTVDNVVQEMISRNPKMTYNNILSRFGYLKDSMGFSPEYRDEGQRFIDYLPETQKHFSS